MHDVKKFFGDETYLYRSSANRTISRCVQKFKMLSLLEACHSLPVRGDHNSIRKAHKILQFLYYWPPSTKMLMSLLRHVIGAKEIEAFRRSKSSL